MSKTSKIYAGLLLVILQTACSALPKFSQEKPDFTYQDFEQRAPASMNPPSVGDKTFVDQVQAKSQADYHFTMAEAYALEGQTDRAIESYKLTLVYDTKSPTVHFKLAVEYMKKGFINEAMEEAEAAIQLQPDMKQAHFLLGSIYSNLKMYVKAKDQYQEVLRIEPKNEEATLYIGAVLVDEKKTDEAIKYFDKVAKNPTSKMRHLGYYYMGRIQAMNQKTEGAEKNYTSALKSQPDFEMGVLALGQLYEEKMQREKAKKLYKTFEDKFGDSEKVAEVLGRLYMEDEDYDSALKQFAIVEKADDNLSVKVKVALILIEKKDYALAITKLKQILQEVPESDKIRFFLAAVYEEVRDYDKSIELYREIPLASSFYVESSIHGIYLLKSQNKYTAAMEWSKLAIDNRPDAIQLYTLRASLLDDQKKYQEGLEMLQAADKQFPNNEQLTFFIGTFYDKLGKRFDSLATMKKVLTIDPEHTQAMNYIAYTYADMGQNLGEAEDMAILANQLKPKDPYFMDTLGWVYYKQGRFNDSIKILEAAYKLQPRESIIAEHLGDAYYRYQVPQKAKAFYKKALELEDSDTGKRKIQDKMAAVDSSVPAKAVRAPASQN